MMGIFAVSGVVFSFLPFLVGMRAIVEGSGTRFDPVAVSALQALHQRGVVDRIRGEVSDTAD